MTVKDLIDELKEMPQDWPVCIDDYIGSIESTEETIKIEKKKYITFPFTNNDEFNYINLRGQKFDYYPY